jgi:hypothetical protein
VKFRPFIEARELVHTLGLNSSSEWLEYCKSGNKPEDIPYSPHTVYKDDWKELQLKYLLKILSFFVSIIIQLPSKNDL